MNYSLRQLRTFVAVAHHGSFSRAGEAIGLSQSAVSHSIRSLESEMGLRLLDRTTREVVLTEAGKRLANRLDKVLEELHGALLDARTAGHQLSGLVRLASSQTISANLMPQCLAKAATTFPAIEVRLSDQPQQWVLQSVRNAEVDFGIIVDPIQSPDFDCQPILSEPFLALVAASDPLAAERAIHWSALAGKALVLQDYASGSRYLIDKALEHFDIKPEVTQEIGHPVTLYPMVEAGLGVGIIPALALPPPMGSTVLVKPLLPSIKRQLMLVKRKNRSLSPAAEQIWQLVAKEAATLAAIRQTNVLFQ
ncbi:LysR family transcriptional regulator [Gallaecimonas mangrovi]|uniref:LysR family transcriptional regulator n=1 Tax=Gallaecimonas mangrovi TaxID=2291597 RepID=UPI000E2091F4|nr:LysR family transcriptional regulator [Gallaecimonas mangrovi]